MDTRGSGTDGGGSTSRLVVAYELGRLLPWFVFHAHQAVLRLDLDTNYKQAVAALERLAVGGRALQPAAECPSYQAAVTSVRDKFEAEFAGEPETTFVEDLQADLDRCRVGGAAVDLLSGRVALVDRLYLELRQLTLRHSTDDEARAFELGEVVARGVCPEDVWEDCLVQKGDDPSCEYPDLPRPNFRLAPVDAGQLILTRKVICAR